MFERFNGNVVPFADESTSTNRTVFGSETQSDDIDDNLNADFKKGWEIVGLNDNPTREDFNAMGYTLGYLISYLYQNGVAEYNLLQEYKTNSIAIGADGNIYQSLVDNNLGNALTDTTKWVCIASKNSIVNSIAELKTISNVESINVLGYYEKGDGGGGTFYWDATSTETDNGGTIIQSTGVTTGRWKRVFSGAVNVKWFGAKGDGVTDDTEAIQASLNNATNSVFFDSGLLFITTYPIKIPKGISIYGDNAHVHIGVEALHLEGVVKTNSSTVGIPDKSDPSVVQQIDCVFYLDYTWYDEGFYPQGYSIDGLNIGYSVANNGSICVYFKQGSNLRLSNCSLYNAEYGFYGKNIWISSFTNLRVSGKFYINSGTSLEITGVSSSGNLRGHEGLWLNNVTYSSLRNCTSDGFTNNPCYKFSYCRGVSVIGCGAEGNSFTSSTKGWALQFEGYNSIEVSGFSIAALANTLTPITSCLAEDNIVFIGCSFEFSRSTSPLMPDLYIQNNSFVRYVDCPFASNIGTITTNNPVVVGGILPYKVQVASKNLLKVIEDNNIQEFNFTKDGVSSGISTVPYLGKSKFFAKSDTNFTGTSFRSDSLKTGDTSWYHMFCSSSGNNYANLLIFGNGNVQNANNSYGAFSDIKLKENIVDATPKLEKLMQVRVVNYNLTGDYENHKQIGVIAQELEQVFPSLVYETNDLDAEGNDLGTTTKSVKYSVFVPMLVKAIQEQQAIITDLTARIEALEAK